MVATVNVGKCTGCQRCLRVCPMKIIEMRGGKAFIGNGCVGCGACVSACPRGAISL